MSLRFSHTAFPCTPEQKAGVGLPWGCLLQPLAPLPVAAQTRARSSEIARCANCFAYINPHVVWLRGGWKCTICRTVNTLTSTSTRAGGRYHAIADRARLPELLMQDVEYAWVEADEADAEAAQSAAEIAAAEEEASQAAAAVAAYRAASDFSSASYDPSATLSAPFVPAASAALSPPAYLFLVDLSGDYNYVELLKASLLAAIEALSPQCWVGLAVVSSKLGLYDLRCAMPSVSYVALRSAEVAHRFGPDLDEQPASLPLHTILSLDHFLQQLQHCKENLATAIESLHSHQVKVELQDLAREVSAEHDFESGGASSSPSAPKTSSKDSTPRVHPCGFGGALAALTSYLSSVSDLGFETNIRLLCFLSQRPNWGLGALADRVAGRDQSGDKIELNEDDWNRFLFQPNTDAQAWSGASGGPGSAAAIASGGRGVSSISGAEFYRSLATDCSARGICIDTYLVASSPHTYFDLATLRCLSVLTGGNMILYPSAGGGPGVGPEGECTLPQDLFRQLRLTQAFRCLLRLRCSPEFQASNVYGHLVADTQHADLYRLGGCDARKVYAVDFDFTGSEGFRGGYADVTPCVQVAFSYIGVRMIDGVPSVEHRLRIMTRQLPLVHFFTPQPGMGTKEARALLKQKSEHQAAVELHTGAQADIVLALLVHQVIHASLERGVHEARELVKDWLVNFVQGYHQVFGVKKTEPAAAGQDETKEDGSSGPAAALLTGDSLDMTLSSAPSLQFLPRFLFALLRASPLLSPAELHAVTPDGRVYLQCLYSGLEAEYLVKSVYPTLSSFTLDLAPALAPEAQTLPLPSRQALVRVALHHPVLYLTRHSLSGCGDRVFVIDTMRALYILHTGAAATLESLALLPLPHPQHSEAARMLKRVKASTPYLTPRVLCCAAESLGGGGYNAASPAGGGRDATLRAVLAHLLEDEVGAGVGPAQFGYQTFLTEVAKEVADRMNAAQQEE